MKQKSFLLRLPEALYGELEAWAKAERRSVNKQIGYVLERAVEGVRRREVGPVTAPPAAQGKESADGASGEEAARPAQPVVEELDLSMD
jgi:hypothetical protein